MSRYKSWGALKKQMQDLLCDALKDQITYFYTRYHKDRGSFGRATINLNKREIIAFSWDIGIDIQWEDFYKTTIENPEIDPNTIRDQLKNKWMQQGTFSHENFLEAVTVYLESDVSDALVSENYILRIFAYMDRRIGKRSLLKIRDVVETLPTWVRQFYKLRCAAEGIEVTKESDR